jgi:hypothetical protein
MLTSSAVLNIAHPQSLSIDEFGAIPPIFCESCKPCPDVLNLLQTWLVYRSSNDFCTPSRAANWPVERLNMRRTITNTPGAQIKKMVSLLVADTGIFAGCFLALLLALPLLHGQAPARFLGTVTAINGTTLSVKTDAGQSYDVQVPSGAAIKRIAPGQKDLSTAETIQFSDLAVGDRTLVRLDSNATGGTSQAQQIIAVKQSDVADKQKKDQEEWQKNGVGGLVKSVDGAGGVIVLTSGAGASAKTITVHTTKATVLKRYAPASVSYDSATAAPIDTIHAGDQLRARGTKSTDGLSVDATEVVSGTFRNISGTIASLDAGASTLSVKDLATKKQYTIHITPEAQMKKLPERMASMLAARLNGGSGAAGGRRSGAGGGEAAAAPAGGGAGQGAATAGGQATGQGGAEGAGHAGGRGEGGGDPQQMLSRAPSIKIDDLKKGDAVMLVATDGATDVTAITLVAGVEPLLEAPAASSLLSNWSMGGGGGAEAGGGTQ